ncbi:hypothetical protein TWF788_009566 [Orbilia oligospora]|uniref:Uncharacterized protein n=1 Tax=Orbilia oligospora TaxID=2813651 RepID=A0A6G1M6X3_ORBOL|nr:hypothetical protein TWF788_009566 [Orbilia oligospora]KAF3247890.1 hypothetical protein TWF192_006381 [Orbilia oligospora]
MVGNSILPHLPVFRSILSIIAKNQRMGASGGACAFAVPAKMFFQSPVNGLTEGRLNKQKFQQEREGGSETEENWLKHQVDKGKTGSQNREQRR